MKWPLTITLAILLTACADEAVEPGPVQSTDHTAAPQDVIATVDGHAITKADRRLHRLERKKQGKVINADEVLDELVNLKVIVLNAQKEGFHERAEVKAELRRQHDTTLANLYITEQVNGLEITEDDLAEEYEKQLAEMAAVEYSASHILLKSKKDAYAAIDRLDGGDEFGRVASEVSTGPSAENGGELGWFRHESMVPEFSGAVAELDIGEYTEEPVQTSYGWHVIRLTDKRDVERPPLEKVKAQIRQLVMNNRLNDFVQELRKNSTVEIK